MIPYNISPLISIIIPCYGVEKYLPVCIESILSQTYQNIEIFLVDDGSPDRCGEICDTYAVLDSRIKVIHKLNGGLSDARNVAIDIAKGEYIMFVDSDDYVSSMYVAQLYYLVEKYKCRMAICQSQSFVEGTEPLIQRINKKEQCWDKLDAIRNMFYQQDFDTSAWGKIYHRSLFESGIRYPKGLLFEDLPTTYLLMEKADQIAFTNQHLYYYLHRNDSIEGARFSSEKIDSALKIFDLMDSHVEVISKVKKAYKCRMLSFAFHILLKMPDNYEHRDLLYNRIKEYRRTVLWDGRARKKARIAALLSYLGMKTVKRIFILIDNRK